MELNEGLVDIYAIVGCERWLFWVDFCVGFFLNFFLGSLGYRIFRFLPISEICCTCTKGTACQYYINLLIS